MPFDPARYPKNWRAIARRVKDAAGWRCEQCGHPHAPAQGYTLTVHHIDGDTFNNAPDNLVALCQRCHLAIHGRKCVIGQRMFDFVRPAWLRRRRQDQT
jgi:rubredoxin